MQKNKMVKNFIWNTSGSVLSSFNSLFFLIAITRINGIQQAGIFSIAFATASILYIFAIYSGRNCHITDTQNTVKDAEYIIARIITCLAMLGITFVFVLGNGQDETKKAVIVALCMWKCLEAFADVFYAILQKKQELHCVGKSLVLKAIIGLGAFLVVDSITQNLVYACMSLVAVSFSMILLYDIPKAWKLVDKKETIQVKNIIRMYRGEFLVFANTFLVMYLLNAPKYGIERYLTEEMQAIFGIILMPASIIPLFSQFVLAPFITQMTKYYQEKDKEKMKQIEHRILAWIIGFGVLAIGLGYLFAIPVLTVVYGVDVSPYLVELLIILLAYLCYALGYIKIIVLTIYRSIKEQFVVHILCSILIAIVAEVAVKYNGVTGAAWSYLITMAVYVSLLAISVAIKEKKEKDR